MRKALLASMLLRRASASIRMTISPLIIESSYFHPTSLSFDNSYRCYRTTGKPTFCDRGRSGRGEHRWPKSLVCGITYDEFEYLHLMHLGRRFSGTELSDLSEVTCVRVFFLTFHEPSYSVHGNWAWDRSVPTVRYSAHHRYGRSNGQVLTSCSTGSVHMTQAMARYPAKQDSRTMNEIVHLLCLVNSVLRMLQ